MGQLRKRGNVWWIRYYRDGRRYEESARTDKYEKARALLKVREGHVAKGAPISARLGQRRFDEAAADVITDYRVNGKRSICHVERRIEVLTKWFGGCAEAAGPRRDNYGDKCAHRCRRAESATRQSRERKEVI